MSPRPIEGAALLIAGYGAPGVGAFDATVVHTLGQIGEALLATGSPWHVRRLTATQGDRYAADRKTIKRSLATLIDEPVRVGVIVLLGEIVELPGELALVTGAEAHEYPEDATLPLSWIRERIGHAKAERMVIAMSGCGAGSPERWLAALGTGRPEHLVAVDAPAAGNPLIDALLGGLCGDALDRATGTVTLESLSDHLAAHARAIQLSKLGETVAQPPPLAGFWDVRQSQLARPRPRRGDDREELIGTVLPGRFRIDEVVARGTFGTVYRARQLAVERDVAVKVLHADIDPGSGDGKLFVEEIRAVGRLDHTHIVRIYQADITQDGRLFFAMELLSGQDLQKLGQAGTLPEERAVELVRQLLAGLGSAHEAGLVHADIKPANAIVVPPRSTSDDATGSATRERAVLVDFGLARLRPPDRPAESAGGTPAYMAPEQLNDGRVDARSDLFSLALVLVWLLTGWRRPNAFTLIPPLDELIDDADLRGVLRKALDLDPARRYQTARELSAALAGNPAPAASRRSQEIVPSLPFRHLAPLTEADRGRLHGRDADVAQITEHALYRRAVVYAAPSGTGKTSVLRAGLMPRLEALGIHAVYVRCRTDFTWSVVKAIAPGASSIADAITKFHEHRGGKLVLIVDQLEAALADPEFVPALLGFDRWPAGVDVSIVLAIREDWLARLLARTQEIEPNLPIVRLPPLSPEGARTAIVAPLVEYRLGIEPALLDALLADLQAAATAIGPEMGWGDEPAVFPPHLQLACSVLHENLAPGATELTLDDYRRLGRFDAIVGEHLDNVIEKELDDGRDLIARDIFLALVTSANQRAIRPEDELLAIVAAKHGGVEVVSDVLEVLRGRGLVVRVRGDGQASWELVHDSLVARVLAWVDKKDLARRRASELVRHHLRRSTKGSPSLLGRKELREVDAHPGAIAELDAEWSKREAPDVGWTPSGLVARSRQVWRRSVITYSSIVSLALIVGGIGFYVSRVEAAKSRAEASLRDRDLGAFTLRIAAFDWDPGTLRASDTTPEIERWTLHAPSTTDRYQPGERYDEHWLVRGEPHLEGRELVEHIEAHGGPAFLVVERRGCGASIIPLERVPGYAQREQANDIRIRVPSCRASLAGMVEIPEGPFVFGGVGEPPAKIYATYPDYARERQLTLDAFWIDRTEVSNAQYEVFAAMSIVTGISKARYVQSVNMTDASRPDIPVSSIDHREARAFCQFMGKQLPTTEQWTKALRGGATIGGAPNPAPRRNLPWYPPGDVAWISSKTVEPVGSHPEDTSPYGVLDLAGNVSEWTSSIEADGAAIVRGGEWFNGNTLSDLIDLIVLDNPRDRTLRLYSQGMRCALARDGSAGR